MKDKKMYILLVISILFAVVGISLAFFSLNIIGNDTAKYNKITTGDLELVFTDDNEVSLDGAFPGDSITKTISVKNTGTKEVSYNIVWQELLNEITNNELVIDGTCKNLNSSNTEDGTCSAISKKVVKEGNVTSNIPIKPGYTQEYEVKVTFIDTDKPQNYNKNKSFKGKLGLTESSAKTIYCTFDGELTDGAEYVNGQYTYRYMGSSNDWWVHLTDKESTDAVTSDVCTYINNIPITSFYNMFAYSQATSIDLSKINTSNVTNMSAVFPGTKVTSVDLSSFNTSNVVSMSLMFSDSQITSADLSNFNTSNITSMDRMFTATNFETLDLSNFDTTNIVGMSAMFMNSKVTILNLSGFDTSKVTNMSGMFYGTKNLKTIYTSNKFIIDNVVSGDRMFQDCTSLVGGAGTTYDSTKTDKAYAHIDGGTSNPGYFTDIADKPKEPESFATDSWSTIAKAVKDNNISKYNVGDTKTIDMGTYGTHTVRIANTSTPSECSTDGFSQSACGFVLEFADIITTHKMNDTNTNVGGWPASSMHTFVNTNIYDSLPYNLKSKIIDTIVVSGHGSEDTENFTSTDKLYLLSTAEVWAEGTSNQIGNSDAARDMTRQLDYYKNLGITTNNFSGAIKKIENNAALWILRTAVSGNSFSFLSVHNIGRCAVNTANVDIGVSPAFRIG